ncbi:MAG: UDP-2,3-diacylglucosamine hydrolase [Planctomycetota bacterium]|jgi:UDP-2,3-diacylglucosamine hydrolase
MKAQVVRVMAELPVVDLSGETLVIADLHLDPFDASACEPFAAWLRSVEIQRVMVLGDLFDAWVGPAHEPAPGAQVVIQAFRKVAERGVETIILKGNRDFLLGDTFEFKSHARIYPEGLIGKLASGERVLFLHGDELCTRDLAYQRLRRVTHSRWMQVLGPKAPLFISRRVAARMRRFSGKAVARKPSEEKAIQESAVREQAARNECSVLVCGHVHRARDDQLASGLRFVVLDAYGEGSRDVLRISAAGGAALEARRIGE